LSCPALPSDLRFHSAYMQHYCLANCISREIKNIMALNDMASTYG
jgi:hypothetical protein